MKVTLEQLVVAGGTADAPGPLSQLMDVKDFSVRVCYRLAKLAKLVAGELATFETAKNKLVGQYGTKNPDGPGEIINQGDENWDEFAKEYRVLLDEEVELDVEPVVLPPEATGATPAMFVALDGLVLPRGEEESGPKKVVK